MGAFTLELREVLEVTDDIGLNNYPIFDEKYRDTLNQKIITHYFMREIGVETIEIFRHHMNRVMGEIMPYMNQFYDSERLKIDPFKTVDIRSIGTATNEGTGTSEAGSRAGSESRVVASDTPQVRLSGDKDYASSMQDSHGVTDSTSNTSEETKSNSLNDNSTSGYQGSPAELLTAFRETFLNLDYQVIQQLEPLFMGMWDTGDSYSSSQIGYGYGYFNFWRFGRLF